jgi:hypothetical protein
MNINNFDNWIKNNLKNFNNQEKLEINQKTYSKYYNSCFNLNKMIEKPLTFNKWYGSDNHQKLIMPYIRKAKLNKILEI